MSLKKIAKELGLSLTTVSRALNGYPEVAHATRQAVQAAATRHHYQPNARARALALGRADAVGLVFPFTPGDLGDEQFLAVVASMSERLLAEDMDLLIISASTIDEIATFERAIRAQRIDAFVVARTRVHDARLELLQERGVPFVAYGRSAGLQQPYAWFDFDNVVGARLAAERLLGLGHRRFGYIGASPEYNFASQRLHGFHGALGAAGCRIAAMRTTALDRRSGYAAMQDLIAQPDFPRAILIDNNLAGVGAIHAVLNAGLTLGRDVSIIVYDGLTEDSIIRGAITSIRQPTPRESGISIAELMLARLRNEPVEGLHKLCMPALEIGDSDGPPP